MSKGTISAELIFLSRNKTQVLPPLHCPASFGSMEALPRYVTDPSERIQRSLEDGERLLQLSHTKLLGSIQEDSFDRYTRLAATTLRTPISLISFLTPDTQFLKSNFGLTLQPYCETRQTPISASICRYVVHTEEPLVIPDTTKAEFLKESGVPTEFVRAYIGFPLLVNGQALGSLCALDMTPHDWTPKDVAAMRDLAGAVISDINYRNASNALNLAIQELTAARDELQRYLRTEGASIPLLEENGKPREDAKTLAEVALRDSSTHLFNRNFLQIAGERAIYEAGKGACRTLLSLRLDAYEKMKEATDEAIVKRFLAACTRVIGKHLESDDEFIRTEGDGFMIILRSATREKAREAAEQMRTSIADFLFHDSKHDFKTTLSVGVVNVSPTVTVSTLVASVEAASWDAKAKGGNRVNVAE